MQYILNETEFSAYMDMKQKVERARILVSTLQNENDRMRQSLASSHSVNKKLAEDNKRLNSAISEMKRDMEGMSRTINKYKTLLEVAKELVSPTKG